jgi:tetratricopeptide (TPR) repeat protein
MTDAMRSELLEKALKITELRFGVDHPQTAICLNELGKMYYESGNYEVALPLLQRAHQICEEKLGTADYSTLVCIVNLKELHNAVAG